MEPRYFSDKSREIDFVLQYGTEIVPVEVKGGEDKSAPSFKRYISEHHPEHAVRGIFQNIILNMQYVFQSVDTERTEILPTYLYILRVR